MALFSNDKIMSIIMLVAIIFITLLLASYSSYTTEAFAAKAKKTATAKKTSGAAVARMNPINKM